MYKGHKTGILLEKKHSRNSENPVLREAVIMIQVKLQADKAVKMQEIFLLLSTEKTCMIGENLWIFVKRFIFVYYRCHCVRLSICLVTDPGSKMDSSLLAVRDINHKYIVAEADIK